MKSFKNFRNSCYQLKEMNLWDFMHKKYKATFYRGVGKGGRGTGLGALGMGVYLTWSESMAQTFAKHQGAGSSVKQFKVKRGLKLVDVQDQDFADVKKKMGFEPWEWSDSFGFASTLTKELKKLKYDGVISDKEAEGILIFDEKNVEEIK